MAVTTDLVAPVDASPSAERLKTQKVGPGLMPQTFQEVVDIAYSYYRSGMFKDLESAALASAKIMIGMEFGFTPAQSMMGIHLVQGKPMLGYAMT